MEQVRVSPSVVGGAMGLERTNSYWMDWGE